MKRESVLGLHRIQARHMTRNPASGRVLEKIGIRHEGRLRGLTLKWDIFENAEIYGILSGDRPISVHPRRSPCGPDRDDNDYQEG